MRARPPVWRWAIVLADLESVIGSEEGKRRPVLVVSNEDSNQALPNVTVLPLSSTPRKLYPSEVRLPSGAGGQPKDSIAMAHQIRTISKERVVKHYGHLTDPELQQRVIDAILDHLDITFDEE
jgi:mRNA interferase MazF